MRPATIRISTRTWEDIDRLCAERDVSAEVLIAELVNSEMQRSLLDATERHWISIADDPMAVVGYRTESDELAQFGIQFKDD